MECLNGKGKFEDLGTHLGIILKWVLASEERLY
jgi:hypothetical protein